MTADTSCLLFVSETYSHDAILKHVLCIILVNFEEIKQW